MNALHASILLHTYSRFLFSDILFFVCFSFSLVFIGYKNGMEGGERGFLARIKSRIITICFQEIDLYIGQRLLRFTVYFDFDNQFANSHSHDP